MPVDELGFSWVRNADEWREPEVSDCGDLSPPWSFYILVAEKKPVEIQDDAPRDDRRRLLDCARASPLSTRVVVPRERQGSVSPNFPPEL